MYNSENSNAIQGGLLFLKKNTMKIVGTKKQAVFVSFLLDNLFDV